MNKVNITNPGMALAALSNPSPAEIREAIAEFNEDLRDDARAVATAEDTWHMVLMGETGTGKTQIIEDTMRELLGEQSTTTWAHWKGAISPYGLYEMLYDYRNAKVIVIDDTDSVYEKIEAVNVLKAAMDTKKVRPVSWVSNATKVQPGTPSQFFMEARIILITNTDLKIRNPDGRTNKMQRNMDPLIGRIASVVETGFPDNVWRMENIRYLHETNKLRVFKEKNIDDLKVQNMLLDFLDQHKDLGGVLHLRHVGHLCNYYKQFPTRWQKKFLKGMAGA